MNIEQSLPLVSPNRQDSHKIDDVATAFRLARQESEKSQFDGTLEGQFKGLHVLLAVGLANPVYFSDMEVEQGYAIYNETPDFPELKSGGGVL
jgi:hypothetical protein